MVTDEELRSAFAERLKEALQATGHPLRGAPVRMSEVTGVSPNAASKWLKGDSMPGLANLKRLCDWLGIREEWLAFGHDSGSAHSQSGAKKPENKQEASHQDEGILGSLMRMKGKITPNSWAIIQRIAKAAEEGRISEQDMELLERIATRFEHNDNPP